MAFPYDQDPPTLPAQSGARSAISLAITQPFCPPKGRVCARLNASVFAFVHMPTALDENCLYATYLNPTLNGTTPVNGFGLLDGARRVTSIRHLSNSTARSAWHTSCQEYLSRRMLALRGLLD